MKILNLIFLLLTALSVSTRPPVLTDKQLARHPGKVIRPCCAFGSDLKFVAVPFVNRTDIIAIDELGTHHFLSNKNEGNGIIYTRKGGFIDVGHLRDYADWTAYLYLQVMSQRDELDGYELHLGSEGGKKTLRFTNTADLDSLDYYELAGRIAYDLSLWHEIATYFGVSLIPGIPEKFSSFSPEDIYSNLLGVHLGIKALKSEMEYSEAMTSLLEKELNNLEAVHTYDETLDAMTEVESVWWDHEKALPMNKFLLKRHLDEGSSLHPMLLPKEANLQPSTELNKPNIKYSEYYILKIKLNKKFPHKTIFGKKKKSISQHDFGNMVQYIDHTDRLILAKRRAATSNTWKSTKKN